MPRSQQVPPAKPKLISETKPSGSFWERITGLKKGPVTNAGGSRGHMGEKPKPVEARYKDAAKRKLGQAQKDF
jgi:hypothetical protein